MTRWRGCAGRTSELAVRGKTNNSPFTSTEPDRLTITVGKYISIDFAEAQSAGRCGAELPKAIVIPAQNGACRVFLDSP
jgi:hypothetical protein